MTARRATLGCLSLVLLACGGDVEQPLPFNHEKHTVQKGMACIECHPGAETQTWAGMPTPDDCLRCHAFRFSQNPAALRVTDLAPKVTAADPWVHLYAIAPHAHVSHAAHAKAGVPCEKCHGNTGKSNVSRREQMLRGEALMYWCMDCHEEKKASIQCLTCHR